MFRTLLRRRCAVAAAVLAGLGAATVPAANAGIVINNLGSSQDGADPVFGVGPLAQSFRTGPVGGGLNDVGLLLTNGSTGFEGSVDVMLLADNGGTPGATLDSLGVLEDSSIATNGFVTYDIVPAVAIGLTANTTYWIELATATPDAVEWSVLVRHLGDGRSRPVRRQRIRHQSGQRLRRVSNVG